MITPLRQHLAAAFIAALISSPAVAQTDTTKPLDTATKQAQERLPDDQPRVASSPGTATSSNATVNPVAAPGQPSEAEMMKMMMEMSKLNDNHKLLGELVGNWSYAVKMWMDPSKAPTESKGTATRKAEMGGRYFVAEASGKFAMPGPDGQMQQFDFKGRATDAYDNAKQKFVSTWIDNMGTGIMLLEGTYDPASKTFTYYGDYDMAPGVKTRIRETIKITGKDRHTMEWFEQRGGQEVKTMEIAYTRKK